MHDPAIFNGAQHVAQRRALVNAMRHEEARLHFQRLRQQRRVLESLDHGLLALDARVRDLAHLVRVEAVPLLVVELLVKGRDVSGRDEVDKGVADVTLVLEVDR